MTQPVPRGKVAVLGLITIAVYGSWYYSFGVLLDPIILNTGWSEPALTASFGLSTFLGGIAGLGGGFLLDRLGSRFVFAAAAGLGGTAFGVAAIAQTLQLFAISSTVGGAAMGALGMYHITQTAAIRISPRSPSRAIAVLTIWGAFASAVYVPAAGELVGMVGWRWTLGLLTGSAVLMLVVGALSIHSKPAERSELNAARAIGSSLRTPAVRRYVAAIGLVGIGTATLLVYQVPVMTAGGLSLSAASFWAGARGFSQLTGRLPLMPIIARFGVFGSLRLAIAAIAGGMVILAFVGTPSMALAYALVAGFGVGALSPLQGMATRELFDPTALGTSMGLLGAMFLTVGAIGPVLAGLVAEATGSRMVPVLGAAAITGLAVLIAPGEGSEAPGRR